MKCQFVIYFTLTVGLLVNCGVLKRHNEEPGKITADQEINNTTGNMAYLFYEFTTNLHCLPSCRHIITVFYTD